MITFIIIKKQPPEVFYKKDILKTLAKFTTKHLCRSHFFMACNFNKNETPTKVFSCESYEFFKNSFFTEHMHATVYDKFKYQCWYSSIN